MDKLGRFIPGDYVRVAIYDGKESVGRVTSASHERIKLEHRRFVSQAHPEQTVKPEYGAELDDITYKPEQIAEIESIGLSGYKTQCNDFR